MKGYADGVIDQSLLAAVRQQQVAHRLVPMLQRTIPWGDGEAILTGIGDEIFVGGESLKPVFGGLGDVAGELTLGAIAASKRKLVDGDRVTALRREFLVKRALSSSGSIDDIRVYGDLTTVQDCWRCLASSMRFGPCNANAVKMSSIRRLGFERRRSRCFRGLRSLAKIGWPRRGEGNGS
jgi:hypothetical protein